MRVVSGDVAAGAARIDLGGAGGVPEWRSTLRPLGRGRIAPFRPVRRLVPLFFLHIPRCGGGSALRFLERIYGAEGVLRGAEGLLDPIFDGVQPPRQSDCVAGMLPLVRWLHFEGTAAYLRTTMLRNPWARMVSQINHLATIGPEAAGAPGTMQRALAAEVARADFTSRAGLDRFMNRLRLVDGGFDNLQVRMLVTGTMSALVKQITLRDVDVALRELERFAAVGFCEEQTELQRVLIRLTGAKQAPEAMFEGAGRGIALSVRNSMAREALLPLYEFDQELVTRARAMVATRQG